MAWGSCLLLMLKLHRMCVIMCNIPSSATLCSLCCGAPLDLTVPCLPAHVPAGKAAASSVKKQAAGGFRLKPLAGLQEEEGAGEGEDTPVQRKAGGSSKKDSAAAGAAAPPSSSRRTPGRTASAAARQKLSEVADSDEEEEEEGGEASGSDGGASEEGSDYMDDE
jgi:hypothetical protein